MSHTNNWKQLQKELKNKEKSERDSLLTDPFKVYSKEEWFEKSKKWFNYHNDKRPSEKSDSIWKQGTPTKKSTQVWLQTKNNKESKYLYTDLEIKYFNWALNYSFKRDRLMHNIIAKLSFNSKILKFFVGWISILFLPKMIVEGISDKLIKFILKISLFFFRPSVTNTKRNYLLDQFKYTEKELALKYGKDYSEALKLKDAGLTWTEIDNKLGY